MRGEKIERHLLECDISAEQRANIALECAGQGLWEVNNETKQDYYSPAWFAMRGLDPNDITATYYESWMKRIHPEDFEQIQARIALETNGAIDLVEHEYRERHAKGHWIWILSRGRVIKRNAFGKTSFVIGVDTDISHLKETQANLIKLADSERRWRIAVESAGQGLWDINRELNINYFSDAWRTIRGLAVDEPEPPTSTDWFDLVHPDDRENLREEVRQRDDGTSNQVQHTYRQRHKDGGWVWILSRGKIVERDAEGKILRMIGTDTDITAIKNSEYEFRELSHRHELAMANTKFGIWEFDISCQLPILDENTKRILGLTGLVDEELTLGWQQRIHPDDRERVANLTKEIIDTQTSSTIDYRLLLPDGEIKYVQCSASLHQEKIASLKLVGTIWDNTKDHLRTAELLRAKELAERGQYEVQAIHQTLEHNALHDALTGLPNRRQLDNALEKLPQTLKEGNISRVAILHVDLDRFKQINDTFGHSAGDAILKRAAEILSQNCPAKSLVSRTGGDEFVILLTNEPTQESVEELATRLLVEFNKPVYHNGHECLFGASIGIALQPAEEISGRGMFINADIALYKSKSEGRNRFRFFTADMQKQAIANKKCADDIRRGLERGEFFPVYQPQFDAKSRAIIGVEALARWRHPERGILSPDAFLGIAEEINAVARIDELVLEQALKDLEIWRHSGVPISHVSVNISSKRLGDVGLIKGLRKLSIPKDSISFELLESIYLDNHNEIVAQNLADIRDLGIGIEIDDFGTGHASIACLYSLRPKRLKIDRQLVMPILASVDLRRLLASIVDIGKALGIEVLAEGVETFEHARILTELDCDSLQGFAFAHPLEAEALVALLKLNKWKNAA